MKGPRECDQLGNHGSDRERTQVVLGSTSSRVASRGNFAYEMGRGMKHRAYISSMASCFEFCFKTS